MTPGGSVGTFLQHGVFPQGYISARGRRWMAEVAIGLVLVGNLLYGGWNLWGQLVRSGMLDEPFDDWWTFQEASNLFLTLLFTAGLVVAGAFFIHWQRQLLRNLQAMGCKTLDVSVDFASWAWFIPIVAWFVPYRSIRQAARFSHRPGDPEAPALVALWWGAWLCLGLMNRLALVLYFVSDTVEAWISAASFELVVVGVELIAGLLAILVLRTLTEQQDAHARRLAAEAVRAP